MHNNLEIDTQGLKKYQSGIKMLPVRLKNTNDRYSRLYFYLLF